ncbi:TPM domain-containing protein [Lachnoclostridium sp. Marseille-P6806]|uniref:TPM domain-containing protein n=1 Tax=Lachnoclostridium sp. Marseille-P6806 TaxID=2364793 RepID=UPI001030DCB3|nr:TPM domain-containing protein [Lachnoclostridium sp. Marseille-P6806]
MIKYIRLVCMLGLLLLMLPAAVLRAEDEIIRITADAPAYTNPETGYQIYIDDAEELLTAEEEQALLKVMRPITEYGGAAFVSASQYGSTADYAAKRYRDCFGSGSGTLFLIDMGERTIWIHSDGAIYRTVTKAYANTITDNVYREASQGEYYECAAGAYGQINTLLEGGRIAQPMRWITNGLLALILSLLMNFLFVRFKGRDIRPSKKELLAATIIGLAATGLSVQMTNKSRRYSPRSSGSGGGSSGGGGGGFSGGGGGGGGGHKF